MFMRMCQVCVNDATILEFCIHANVRWRGPAALLNPFTALQTGRKSAFNKHDLEMDPHARDAPGHCFSLTLSEW